MGFYLRFFLFIFIFLPTVCHTQVWLGNNLGEKDYLPQPWSPIQILEENENKISVACWGRVYTFSADSFLSQASSLDEEILAAPVVLDINKKNVRWNNKYLEVTGRSETKVTIKMVCEAIVNQTVLTQSTDVEIFYDGLIYFKTGIIASDTFIKVIDINIKLKEQFSDYINRFSNPTLSDKTSWKAEKFKTQSTDFIPYWWIGNDKKGIFWFCQSPENWDNYQDNNAIEFKKAKNGAAEISFNLESNNKRKRWSYEFGLQLTPVKPFPKNYRKNVLIGSRDSNINIIWPEFGKPYQLKYFGFPEAADLQAFNRHIKEITSKGKKTLVYNNITFLSSAVPEWKKFGKKWNAGGEDTSGDVKAYGDNFIRANILDKSFQDFMLWKSAELLNNTALNGYYLDYSMIADINAVREVKKIGDDEKLPYYPVLEMRRLYERFYKMVKEKNSENIIVVHASGRVVPPILGFSDAYVTGEQFNQSVARVNDDYLEVTDLAAFITEYSGKPYGIPAIFLPSFNEANYSIAEPTRSLASLLIVHDDQVWPIYSARVVWDEMFEAFRSFPNFNTAEFLPYYGNNLPFKSKDYSLLVSAYKNNSGHYLLLLSNISEKTITTDVAFEGFLSDYTISKVGGKGTVTIKEPKHLEANILNKDFLIVYFRKKTNE